LKVQIEEKQKLKILRVPQEVVFWHFFFGGCVFPVKTFLVVVETWLRLRDRIRLRVWEEFQENENRLFLERSRKTGEDVCAVLEKMYGERKVNKSRKRKRSNAKQDRVHDDLGPTGGEGGEKMWGMVKRRTSIPFSIRALLCREN